MSRELSILVVDDNHDTADTAAEYLRLSGFRAMAAYGADEALAAMDELPDAVLLDIRMPGKDGWQLAREMTTAAKATCKRPLLVAVTGCQTDDDRLRSEEAGIDLHLVKPVEPATLVGIVKRFATVIG